MDLNTTTRPPNLFDTTHLLSSSGSPMSSTPTTPACPPPWTLDVPSLRLQLYKLRKNTTAARTTANEALTRFELAYATFANAAVPLRSGDVQGYRNALQTARRAADMMFEPQRVYGAAVEMLEVFVGELGAVVWTKQEGKEGDLGKIWAAVGMGEGAEEVQVKLYLARVKVRVQRLEEEEKRLCGAAEMYLRAMGGEGEE